MKKLMGIFLVVLLLCSCSTPASLPVRKNQAEVCYIADGLFNAALGSDGKLYMGGSHFEGNYQDQKNPATPLTDKQIGELPEAIKAQLAEDNYITGQYNWKLVAEDVVDFYVPGPIYYLTKSGQMYVLRDEYCPEIAVPVLLAEQVTKICRTSPISFILEDGSLMMQTDNARYTHLEGAEISTGVSGHPLVKIASVAKDASNWGGRNFAYIDGNGTLWVNGYNDFGTLGNGKYDEVLARDYAAKERAGTPVSPEGYSYTKFYKALDDAREVYVSGSNVFAVRNDGSLWGWGANEYGNVGIGTHGDGEVDTRDVVTKPQKILENVVRFCGGLTSSVDDKTGQNAFMALTGADELYTWGSNRNGNLANGEMNLLRGDESEFLYADKPVKLFGNVKDFVFKTGIPAFAVLLNNGEVYAWGYSADGSVGSGVKADSFSSMNHDPQYAVLAPTKIMEDGLYLSESCTNISVIQKDGSIWSWGFNPFGWKLFSTRDRKTDPTNIWELAVFASPVKNPQISAIIGADGSVSFEPAPIE